MICLLEIMTHSGLKAESEKCGEKKINEGLYTGLQCKSVSLCSSHTPTLKTSSIQEKWAKTEVSFVE